MPTDLAESLKYYGYQDGPERFRKLLADLKAAVYTHLSVEQMSANPSNKKLTDQRLFCEVVRRQPGCGALPDSLIFGTLINIRKRGRRDAERNHVTADGQGFQTP